jgi:hypothetical protein
MDCSTLGTLVVNHEPIELIDVRSRKEFAAMHIRGARSLPFGELAEPGLSRRRRLASFDGVFDVADALVGELNKTDILSHNARSCREGLLFVIISHEDKRLR